MSSDTPRKEPSPELRRGVSRRGFLTKELGRATTNAVRQLPGLAGALGAVLRETTAQRDERLLTNLWQLMMGRAPKPEESQASRELLRNAANAHERADAFVDVLWALGQTKDFEELARPDAVLIRGLYRIALDRDPTDEEKSGALAVLAEAGRLDERVAALEGLFTGLLRSAESVLFRE